MNAFEYYFTQDDKDEFFFSSVNKGIQMCAFSDKSPKELKDLYYKSNFWSETPNDYNLFSSRTIWESNDGVSIETSVLSDNEFLVDIVATAKDNVENFKKEMELISPFKGKVEWKKEKQHFSMRYCLRPYPWVVESWLKSNESISTPNDLKTFIGGAVKYFFSKEWRTSIVLSAIAVESILADLFEENQKQPAPDTPLGDLFRRVQSKCNFPSEIVSAVESTNTARIAAVHRSRFPVSDREAINALFGATNFVIWYHQQ